MENPSREKRSWPSLAVKFCVAVITFAIGIAAQYVSTFIPPVSTPTLQQPRVEISHESADPGTLRETILVAKARGEKTVELSVLACGSDIGRLQTALSRDTVVLAQLVTKKTYADTWGLSTWYKFKIKETLVDHEPPRLKDYPPFQSAPSDMLPIAENEFVIEESNGRIEIDGVTVIQHSNGVWYSQDKTYLMFVWLDASKRTAFRSSTDPLGVFLVENDGNLTSYVDDDYPLKTDLRKRFNNSIDNLREALKKK